MMGKMSPAKAQGILAWHPDRLARNAVDAGRIVYLLDRNILTDLKFPTFLVPEYPSGTFHVIDCFWSK